MEANGYEEQLYLMLRATRQIAERAYWRQFPGRAGWCGADMQPECAECRHYLTCKASKAADEAEAKLKAWNITTE